MKIKLILNRAAIAACIAVTGFLTVDLQAASKESGFKDFSPAEQFKASNLHAKVVHNESGNIRALYAPDMAHGGSPVDSARNYIIEWGDMHGVTPDQIRPMDVIGEVPLRYNRETDSYGLTLLNFEQAINGIPVFQSRLMTLVRNEPGYPVVHIKSDLKPLKGWTPGPIANDAADHDAAVQAGSRFLGEAVELVAAPSIVVYAGAEQEVASPILGMSFEVTSGDKSDGTYQRWLLISDLATGNIIYNENRVLNCGHAGPSVAKAVGTAAVGDITGRTSSQATDGSGADTCESDSLYGMPYIFVSGNNGQSAVADADGNWSMSSSGSVTVTSAFDGQYFSVNNDSGGEASFSTSVSNGGDAYHHHTDTSEYALAQADAYLHSNVVRDFVLFYNPLYPVINSENGFPVNVNLGSSCNAYYDYESINFYNEAGGCSNTAFSVIVHHEYGHHLVSCAGSGQNEYGEGMGDVMGVLITGDNQLARGFYTNDCNNGIRNADNSCQYQASGCSSCGSQIHACGQLISGVVWDLVDLMSDDFDTAARIVIDSLPLHDGTSIDGAILLDYLVLDDDDGDISNGTPNSDKIYSAFNQHGITPDDIPIPPDNDDCITARPVTWGSWEVNTTGAASSGVPVDESQCSSTYMTACDPDVWYQLVACGTGSMSVSLCNTAGFDTDLAVYTGDCNGLSQIACNGDASGCDLYTSALSVDVTLGQIIYVRIGGYNGASGTGTVVIDGPGEPCDNATIAFAYPDGLPDVIDPIAPTTIRVEMSGGDGLDPVPGSGMMYVQQNDTVIEGTMTEVDANIYDARFPPLECTAVSYWFTTQGDDGAEYQSPEESSLVYSDIIIIIDDDGESDPGWTVSGSASDGQWNRGVPVNCARCDPPTDSDGSGQCWLTDNSSADSCNSDVDGGTTVLTSPLIDASHPNTVVSYSRWYNNGSGCTTAPQDDGFLVEASNNGGGSWTTIESLGSLSGGWVDVSFAVSDLPGNMNTPEFRLRFTASDTGEGSVVEAGIDSLTVSVTECNDVICIGDLNGDGAVGIEDLLAVLADWGNPYNVEDLLIVIGDWGCN